MPGRTLCRLPVFTAASPLSRRLVMIPAGGVHAPGRYLLSWKAGSTPPMLARLSSCLHPRGRGRTRRGMSYNPMTQPRSLATGRFLPGPTAPESPVTIGATQAAQRQSNAYRHLSEGGIHADDRRRLGQESLRELLASGMLHRMVGTSNIAAVEQIMAASRDTAAMDAALDAVADMERREPGSVPPGAFGKKLAAELFTSVSQAKGAA